MDDDPTWSDSTLSAWLDGELPAEQRAEVEAWLREHPEAAARVRLWAADAEGLRARLDAVLAEPVPARFARLVQPDGEVSSTVPAPNRGWRDRSGWRWAAAVALFALGGATGALLTWRLQPGASSLAAAGGADPAWVRRAAVAHAVYVPEQRHAVEVKAQEEHLSRWLTKRLDVPVKLFDLREQGFELVGGRLLPDAAGPSAQLMYQQIATPAPADGGKPAEPLRVTVYLRKPDSATPAAFRYEQQNELGTFYWVEGDSAHGRAVGYALVGALPRERLLALAEAIYRQGLEQ